MTFETATTEVFVIEHQFFLLSIAFFNDILVKVAVTSPSCSSLAIEQFSLHILVEVLLANLLAVAKVFVNEQHGNPSILLLLVQCIDVCRLADCEAMQGNTLSRRSAIFLSSFATLLPPSSLLSTESPISYLVRLFADNWWTEGSCLQEISNHLKERSRAVCPP